MAINSYRDLEVWRKGVQLSLAVYRLTADFPDSERFGLTSQMRRCSVSIPSNIAEGHARLSTREYLRYLSISLGSLAELETQLHISSELGFGVKPRVVQLFAQLDNLGKQLRALTKALRTRIDGAS